MACINSKKFFFNSYCCGGFRGILCFLNIQKIIENIFMFDIICLYKGGITK